MDSTTRTEGFEGASASLSVDVAAPEDAASTRDLPTAEHVVTAGSAASAKDGASEDAAATQVRPSMVAAIREQCPACGAALASDQRYCVECGERCGPTRVPLADGLGQRPRETPTAARPRRRGLPLNSTLIAGVGTLLLAMGVGVLIGRSGNATSSKSPPVRIVTVAGGGGTASTPTASTPAQTSAPAAAATTKASGRSGAAATKSPSKAAASAPPKTVKIGSPGKGAGYQHGHFTGNFFGSESETKE